MAHRDGARAALLEWRVVEERVGTGVQDLVRKGRGLDRLAEVHPHAAPLDALEERSEPAEIRGLVEAVVHRLLHERVVGNLDRAAQVLLAGDLIRKRGRKKIVRLHPLQREGHFPSAAAPQDRERAGRVPAPARRKHRRGQEGLRQDLLDSPGADKPGDRLQGDRLGVPQRQDDRVVGRRGLELHVERLAHALAEREAEAAVDPCSVGAVEDDLEPSRLVEEPLHEQVLACGDDTDGVPLRPHVADDLVRAVLGEPALRFEPRPGCVLARLRGEVESAPHLLAQVRDLGRELVRSGGGLSQPEGNRRRGALGVDDAHAPVLDPADAPAMGPQQKHVSREALDGPVLVDRPDDGSVRLEHDRVLARVGDGAARGEGGDARSPAGSKAAVYAVAVEVDGAAAARRLEAAGQHLEHGLVRLARELGVGERPTYECVELLLVPLLGRAGGDDLLGQDVDGCGRDTDPIESAASDGPHEGRALEELVSRRRKEAAPGTKPERVSRASHPLQEGGDAPRGADLADEIDEPDVDSELERRGGDQGAKLSVPQEPLHALPPLAREAPVVGHHLVGAETLPQPVGEALGQAARVREDERRSVFPDELGDPVEQVVPVLRRGDRLEVLLARYLDIELQVPLVTQVDDRALGRAVRARAVGAREEPGEKLDRLLRGREPHARGPPLGERVEPREGERQVRTAAVSRERVDLVDDDRPDPVEERPASLGSEEEKEGLRRRDEEVRRPPEHRLALRGRRVSRANRNADLRDGPARSLAHLTDLFERPLEVSVDVVGERPEGTHVDRFQSIVQGVLSGAPDEPVEDLQEGSERLPRSGGRGNQRVLTPGDRRPAETLRIGGNPEPLLEPRANGVAELGARSDGHRGDPRAHHASSKPRDSGNPSIRFRFWIAAPAAPLPRLSRQPRSTRWPAGFETTQRSTRFVSLHIRGSNVCSSLRKGSRKGCTRTNGSAE